LKRLAKRAETYQDEEPLFFSVRKEDNEFSVLSSSLNKMLHRIADDKRVLKETIGSLKATNVELKKAQNDVIRAEKLATVGRLTSGIAHEIGNPIGIVLGYLDLLKQTDLTISDRNDFMPGLKKRSRGSIISFGSCSTCRDLQPVNQKRCPFTSCSKI
jgi:two-component system NtrC family sensor kinase